MKQLLLFFMCCTTIIHAMGQALSQTKTSNNITINFNAGSWVNRTPASFAANDNVYAYTIKSTGHFPISTDHYNFDIPAGARIDKIVTAVRKFKSGRSEVKDLPGVTWLIKGCCDYGPSMPDPNPWKNTETEVIYQQNGSGTDDRGNAYSWSPADINNELFGFTFYPKVDQKGGGSSLYIDQIKITVFYTLASQLITERSIPSPTVKDETIWPQDLKAYVYPNPARQKVTIAFQTSEAGKTSFSLYNMQGILVRTYNLVNAVKGLPYQETINLSGIPAGSYIYKVENGANSKKGMIIKAE